MEKPRVYIETTIPSAYFDLRRDPAMVARRDATRRWWATASERYTLVTGSTVLEELMNGPIQRRGDWLTLIAGVPVLALTPAVRAVVEEYLRQKLMPSRRPADAEHLAFASYYRCEYLLTWNLKHLANANKSGHIQRVNRILGLFVPRIVTPSFLLGEARGTR